MFKDTGDLKELQDEVSAWSLKNFGKVPAWMPLLGVCEELGELADAYLKWDTVNNLQDISDAAVDTVVFLANFCGRAEIDLKGLVETYGYECNNPISTAFGEQCEPILIDLLVLIGEMQHAYLKYLQGIRVKENHTLTMSVCAGRIYGAVERFCADLEIDLIEEMKRIWPEVQKRDWKKNPETAHLE